MRLFIAIDLSIELQSRLSRAAAMLVERLPEGSVRWVGPEGRHLTLKFLGEVASDRLDEVGRAMQEAVVPHAPFHIDLSGFGAFPDLNRPRVLWVGIENEDGGLLRVQSALEDRLVDLGFEREGRRFHPHVTLGRVGRNVRGREARELGKRLGGFEIDRLGGIDVSQVWLIRSELKPSGAVYTQMAAAALKGVSSGS
jgi:2'-5' RNA ligase